MRWQSRTGAGRHQADLHDLAGRLYAEIQVLWVDVDEVYDEPEKN